MDLAFLLKCLVSQLIASCLAQLVVGIASKRQPHIFWVLGSGLFRNLGQMFARPGPEATSNDAYDQLHKFQVRSGQ